MENYRIFVEKHPRFRVEADSLRRELNTNLNLDIRSLRLLNVYDLFGFSRELLEKSRYSVFGEVVTDSVTDSCDLAGRKYIAVEYLPGQFDQRAASARRPRCASARRSCCCSTMPFPTKIWRASAITISTRSSRARRIWTC